MADAVEKTGKTVQQALEAALHELGAGLEDVTYEVLSEPTKGILGIFGAKPAKVRAVLKEQAPHAVAAPAATSSEATSATVEGAEDNAPAVSAAKEAPASTPSITKEEALAEGQKFLGDVFAAMKIDVTINTEPTKEGYMCQLIGDNLGMLIGKHGQTLDALQYLTNIAANRKMTGDRVRLILDVENYRRRREETLQRLATHLAEKACRLREEIRLEPMNRHERKIIHMTLQDHRRVSTYSDGEEPHRFVVIVPKIGRRD